MRCIGIDLGEARTGVAVSDPYGITCTPLEVIRERDTRKLLLRILEVASNMEAECIVVGLPRPLNGGENSQTERVRNIVSALSMAGELEVAVWDERFTSKLAEAGRRNGEKSDAVAACYMLQDYLNARSNRRGEA